MILPMNPHSLLQSIIIKPRPGVFTCDMGWARFYGLGQVLWSGLGCMGWSRCYGLGQVLGGKKRRRD